MMQLLAENLLLYLLLHRASPGILKAFYISTSSVVHDQQVPEIIIDLVVQQFKIQEFRCPVFDMIKLGTIICIYWYLYHFHYMLTFVQYENQVWYNLPSPYVVAPLFRS